MYKRFYLYLVLALSLGLQACQKEALPGDRDYRALGTSAHDLLSASSYRSLRVEISYMPGYEPDAASLASLAAFLEQYLNKPGGVQVTSHAVAASGKQVLSLSEVVGIEKKVRTAFTAGSTLAVHILIADADYSDPESLALSYWNTSFCLFGKTIYRSGSTSQSRAALVSTLLQHEFGHLLGLVGQGSPEQTPHRDAANGAHCSNRACLMYYAVESHTGYTTVPKLDAPCAADLKANGGK